MKSSAELAFFGVDRSRRLALRCLPEGLSVEVIDISPGRPFDTRVIVLNDRQVDKLRSWLDQHR